MLIFSSFIFPITFFRPALCCVKQRKQEKKPRDHLHQLCMNHVFQEGVMGDRGFLKIKMLFDMTWLVLCRRYIYVRYNLATVYGAAINN